VTLVCMILSTFFRLISLFMYFLYLAFSFISNDQETNVFSYTSNVRPSFYVLRKELLSMTRKFR
jgi:hypothetical protein